MPTGFATNPEQSTTIKPVSAERLKSALVAAVIAVISAVGMLRFASPELWWDEADYVSKIGLSWSVLWGTSEYERHWHGPMAMYLAKIGQHFIPASLAPVEVRLRLLEALIGSLAVGGVYFVLRMCFTTSRTAALVGSVLLLFSVIRLQETNVIGPHQLFLVSTIGILGLGFYWRNTTTWKAAAVLGALLAFGAVTMTYAVPLAICWALAVWISGGEWIKLDSRYLKFSRATLVALATTLILLVILWPPDILHSVLLTDFTFFLHFAPYPTLIGNLIYVVPPRWAFLWWLAHLDAPMLIASASVITIAMWRAARTGRFSPKHAWLAVCLIFMVGTALAAHIAGARNLLQALGVMCLATGALFDELFPPERRLARMVAGAAIMVAAIMNLAWLAGPSPYIPYPATDGYRAFVQQNRRRLHEDARAVVYGVPVLNFYLDQERETNAWNTTEFYWAPLRNDLPPGTKYVLVPQFVYEGTPPENQVRSVVAKSWKVVWSYKVPHVWELRLYQNPASTVN